MKTVATVGLALAATFSACRGDQEPTQSASTSLDAVVTTSTAPKLSDSDAGPLVAELKARGLPIAEIKTFTAADDPNDQLGRPGGYKSKTSWHDSRVDEDDEVGVDGGGSIEAFDNAKDAKKRYDYVDALSHGNAMFNEYHWLVGKAFLRVSKRLTPDEAEAYHAALTAILS